ncbi:hypothetical protein IMSAG192_00773 [Muribaculaceae bacterium]|nr:hypothetical protein IMSAG192_00773 [Muribaculaceae bacterium]
MYKRVAVLVAQTQGLGVGVIIDSGHKPYIGAVLLGSLYLGDWRALGEAYQRLDAVGLGSESHSLRMVACRACYHAVGFLFLRQLRYLIVSSTEFKRTGVLQTLGL